MVAVGLALLSLTACSSKRHAPTPETEPSAPIKSVSQHPVTQRHVVDAASVRHILINSKAWAAKNNINLALDYQAALYLKADQDAQFLAAIKHSANNGDAVAETILGLCYFDGCAGLQETDIQSTIWLYRAASNGLPIAQYYLLQYANDPTLAKNLKHGSWLVAQSQKAAGAVGMLASDGNVLAHKTAQFVAAAVPQTLVPPASAATVIAPITPTPATKESPTPTTDAHALRIAAANGGDLFAQLTVGEDYMTGNDVLQNYIEAAKWFILVKADSHAPGYERIQDVAANNLTALEAKMTPAEVAAAQASAAAWYQQHHTAALDTGGHP